MGLDLAAAVGAIRQHWSVTFAVDDADATADRAAQLGGRVDVPPFDAPWVRMTMITDPQGARARESRRPLYCEARLTTLPRWRFARSARTSLSG
jgi:hypothetical protein